MDCSRFEFDWDFGHYISVDDRHLCFMMTVVVDVYSQVSRMHYAITT